jgi:hypothetical protein
VTVDAEREIEGRSMLRATHFVITTDAPTSVWEIELPAMAGLHGLSALGVLGVVYGAIREPGKQESPEPGFFVDPEDISAIFALEDDGPLSVQLEDVWLPLTWCLGSSVWGEPDSMVENLSRGDVLRVELEVFQQAYRYTAGDISLDELLETDAANRMFASPEETQAMARWAEQQIEETRRAFPAKEVKLRYREE